MILASHNYGKQRIRVLKVLRDSSRHEVKELDCGVRLEGDFEDSVLTGDNRAVVPTDTMKNTVHALAHEHLGMQTEPFARLMAEHFLDRYRQVSRVTIETTERRWDRMIVDGKPHEHSFTGSEVRPVVKVIAARGEEAVVESGITELLIMKSTGSGFAGFPRCEYTTLAETTDRILATKLSATWRWSTGLEDFNAANAAVVGAMLRIFALNYSPSVQTTLQDLAAVALKTCREISQITLSMPNKHCLPANLQPFGLDGAGVSFVPTDEPHGQIEATFFRDDDD